MEVNFISDNGQGVLLKLKNKVEEPPLKCDTDEVKTDGDEVKNSSKEESDKLGDASRFLINLVAINTIKDVLLPKLLSAITTPKIDTCVTGRH